MMGDAFGQIENKQMFNISDTLSDLDQAAGYLRLAYAGSKGFSCSAKIIQILCDYQLLISDSTVACNQVVESCIFEAKQHKLAERLAEKKTYAAFLKILSTCEKRVQKMIETSDQLMKECDGLCALAREALLEASDNEIESRSERAKGDSGELSSPNSLEGTIVALAKTLLIFKHVNLYWLSSQHSCQIISSHFETLKLLADLEMKELMISEMSTNQKEWLGLGAINTMALRILSSTKEKMEDLLNDSDKGI